VHEFVGPLAIAAVVIASVASARANPPRKGLSIINRIIGGTEAKEKQK
jgi:hypothetical protein